MKEQDKKRLLIVASLILAAIIIWLLLQKKGNILFRNGEPITNNFGGVNVGGLNFGDRGGFVVPNFGYDPGELSAIGACCVDCGSNARQTRQSYLPASDPLTIVYNAGAAGPTVYNYFNPPPTTYSGRMLIRGG